MALLYRLMTLTIAASATAWAADAVQCPLKIEVNQRLAVQAPGWSAISDALPHQLAGLTFFDGNPADKASLAPDKQVKINGKSVASWVFPAGDRPTWVACRYAWTEVQLARALPKSTRTCSITYSTGETISGFPVIEKVDCK